MLACVAASVFLYFFGGDAVVVRPARSPIPPTHLPARPPRPAPPHPTPRPPRAQAEQLLVTPSAGVTAPKEKAKGGELLIPPEQNEVQLRKIFVPYAGVKHIRFSSLTVAFKGWESAEEGQAFQGRVNHIVVGGLGFCFCSLSCFSGAAAAAAAGGGSSWWLPHTLREGSS